jgi:hypothetical protein
MVSVKKKN